MHLPVTSPGAEPGEVVTDPIECELGVLEKGATPKMDKIGLTCGLGEPGVELPPFMDMKWGEEGSYGGQVDWLFRGWWFFPVMANHMKSMWSLHSREMHGLQYWSKFVEGPPEPLEASFDEREHVGTLGARALEHADQRRTDRGQLGRLIGLTGVARGTVGSRAAAGRPPSTDRLAEPCAARAGTLRCQRLALRA